MDVPEIFANKICNLFLKQSQYLQVVHWILIRTRAQVEIKRGKIAAPNFESFSSGPVAQIRSILVAGKLELFILYIPQYAIQKKAESSYFLQKCKTRKTTYNFLCLSSKT